MVSLLSLWMPILVSAVIVFLASSILHMVLTYHHSDYRKLPGEERIMEAMRKEGVTPGGYAMPRPNDPKEMGSPEMAEKYKAGPVAYLNVLPSAPPSMGRSLLEWFAFCVLIGILTAYAAGLALAPGTGYRMVFRITSSIAFMAYGVGGLVDSIWMGRSWSTTIKHLVDGLIYSLLTGGTFGWLWPD